jgi:exosome complex component RRP42
MLSDGEVRFIRSGVLDDIRVDGRSRLDFRPLSMETRLLPQANGSARCVLFNCLTLVMDYSIFYVVAFGFI